jgi:hypothetical protein
MRILNLNTDAKVDNTILYLTKSEAQELIGYLENLLANPSNANHHHLSADDYTKELTVCVYDTADLSGFDDRSKKLIANDI